MVILTIKISRTFLVSVYLSICNFPYFLTEKQTTKKVREIQINQILIVSITICYIFCALSEVGYFEVRSRGYLGEARV